MTDQTCIHTRIKKEMNQIKLTINDRSDLHTYVNEKEMKQIKLTINERSDLHKYENEK